MNIRPDFPPEGYEFVEKPDDATHVWEHDWSIIDLSVCPCYSRSLRGWLRKLPEPVVNIVNEKIDWVDCPICGGCDNHRITDGEDGYIITCTNLACASNGGDNDDAWAATKLEKEKKKEREKDARTEFGITVAKLMGFLP